MIDSMRIWLALLLALLLAGLTATSVVEAQVGSRGAVEVRREAEGDVPTPPEEPQSALEAEAPEPAPEPAPQPEPETATEPEPAIEPEPEAHAATEPAPASESDPAPETAPETAPAPAPETARESAPTRDRAASTPTEQTSAPDAGRETTVVLEREADPILDELRELVSLFGRDRTASNLAGLLVLFVLALALTGVLRRVRARFPSEGLIPNTLALAHVGVRLVVMALALAFIVRALPPRLSLVMLLAFAGLAVAIGWSLRDVMPDLVASMVIAFERRIRRGVWVSGEGFAGHVERLGVRATLLYDSHGNRVMVPNREIVRAPVTAGLEDMARELEVELRIAGAADDIRAAIRDAVLTSPWVHPDARPVVLRDPSDPTRWRVRARLLEASFGARFEGELLERVEALMRQTS